MILESEIAPVEVSRKGAVTGSLPSKWDGHAAFKSAHVEWGTPPDLYKALDAEFHFTLDPCKPGNVWDGREISWQGQRVFCNPPYGRGVDKWLAKGPEADVAVFLLPARTDTLWFHDHALHAAEIRFFKGRLKFVENHRICPKETWLEGAPFPSLLVVYRKEENIRADASAPGGKLSEEKNHE